MSSAPQVLGDMVQIKMIENSSYQESTPNSYKRNRMAYILKTCMWSDCEFVIEEKRLRAHKLVLACNSPVFESMFFGVLATNKPVQIVDSSFEDFEILLEYCYTEQAPITSVEQAWNLIYLAKKYMIEGLEKLCDDFILNNLTITNLMISFELSSMYDKTHMVERIEKQIFTFVKEVFYHTTYHPRLSTLTHFLHLDKQVVELHPFLLMGTVRWAYVETEKNIPHPSVSDVWNTMEEVGLVRYLSYLDHQAWWKYKFFHGVEATPEQRQTVDLTKEVYCRYLKEREQLPQLPTTEMLCATEERGTFRMPPQKAMERNNFNEPLHFVHKVTPSRDCVLTGIHVSYVIENSRISCDILVRITEELNRNNRLEVSTKNMGERYGLGISTRVDFLESVVTLKAKCGYFVNVFYVPRNEAEVVIYNLVPHMKTKTVNFEFEDNPYAVLLGLCFFPL